MSAANGSPTGKHFVTSLIELGRNPNIRIVRELRGGPRRYNELLAAITGLSEPVVGGYLRELDGDGLVRRRVDPGPPLRVLYELTPLGHELAPSLETIASWTRRAEGA